LHLALLRFVFVHGLQQTFNILLTRKVILQTFQQNDTFCVPVSSQKLSRFGQSFLFALFLLFLKFVPAVAVTEVKELRHELAHDSSAEPAGGTH
jgi:hypothetical protein